GRHRVPRSRLALAVAAARGQPLLDGGSRALGDRVVAWCGGHPVEAALPADPVGVIDEGEEGDQPDVGITGQPLEHPDVVGGLVVLSCVVARAAPRVICAALDTAVTGDTGL